MSLNWLKALRAEGDLPSSSYANCYPPNNHPPAHLGHGSKPSYQNLALFIFSDSETRRTKDRIHFMKISPVLHLLLVALCWNHATCQGQTTGDDEEPSIRLVNPTTSEWEMGLRLSVAGGEATGIVATCPLPVEWPEQSIKLLTKDISDNVSRVTYKIGRAHV